MADTDNNVRAESRKSTRALMPSLNVKVKLRVTLHSRGANLLIRMSVASLEQQRNRRLFPKEHIATMFCATSESARTESIRAVLTRSAGTPESVQLRARMRCVTRLYRGQLAESNTHTTLQT